MAMADKYGRIQGIVFAEDRPSLKIKVKQSTKPGCRPYGVAFWVYEKGFRRKE